MDEKAVAGAEITPGIEAWLQSLCDPGRPVIATPFRWGPWAVGTNGHVMAAVPYGGRFLREATGLGGGGFAGLAEDLPEPLTFAMATLRAWCGPLDERCPDCTATERRRVRVSAGYDPDDPACDTCDDTGDVSIHRLNRMGTIGGKPFNRRKLALLLELAPGSTVTLSNRPGEMESILVRGDGWRGQIMPVKYDYARHQSEGFAEVRAIEDLVTVAAR